MPTYFHCGWTYESNPKFLSDCSIHDSVGTRKVNQRFTKDTAQLLDILTKIMQVLACSGHKSGPFCANMKGHLCNVFPPDEQPLYMEINSTHCTSSNPILSLSEFLPYGHDRKLNCLMHTQNKKTIFAIYTGSRP